MTFTQLEVFAALARAGSFSRAAALLGITQSAVSHALRALEGELQVQLVRREGTHSPLTDAGTRLLQRANDILQQQEALRQEADAERGIARGTLHVASFGATSSLRLLPLLIAEYRRRQPAVQVQVDERNDDTVVRWLLERRVEVGFVVLPDERFETLPLVEDELVALLPAAHRLAGQRSIAAADLQGEPFIRTSAGSGTQIDRFLAEAGAQPDAIYHFEQISSMLGFVAQGHAVAIAARLAVPEEPPAGMVYRSLSPRQRRITGLAVRNLQRLSPAAAGFVALAQEMARQKRFG
ncbi:LysR family transcriptional regulator [Comamonas humi]